MSHCQLAHIDFSAARTELHDLLGLTGAEISCNTLPAGVSVPFVHAHRQNEEIYIVLEGSGRLYIDGEERAIKAGDCFRVAPAAERCIAACAESALRFLCIQVKEGSLEGFTMGDAVLSEKKTGWM